MLEGSRQPLISVVIPTRNEAQNLKHILPDIPPIVDEVILVDGHSTDASIEVAQELRPDIHVIEQQGKGKGDALRLGFAACSGDIVVMLDADGSTDPQEIPRFVDALLQGFDFAKGSRFTTGGDSEDITFLRRLGNSGFCLLVNSLFKIRFSDLCYGYNAFWRYCLDDVRVDCTGFEVETQLSLRVHKAHHSIVEVPSVEHPRIFGESNLHTFRDGWRVLRTIMTERSTTPFHSDRTGLAYTSLKMAWFAGTLATSLVGLLSSGATRTRQALRTPTAPHLRPSQLSARM